MAPSTHGSVVLMKEINRGLIISIIREKGPMSRVDIAKATGLHASTVTRIVAEFIKEGMIREEGAGENHIGRKPILLNVVPDALFFIGLSLEAASISAVITNLAAQVKTRYQRKLVGLGKDAIVAQVQQALDYLLETAAQEKISISGIGIAAHGIVNSSRGEILHPPAFGWRDLALGKIIADAYELPVRVENNSNALNLAEFWLGNGRGANNLMTLKVGYGIGSGLILDGAPFFGESYSAGEIGHTTVAFDGPRCDCGNYGCLETVASVKAMLQQVRLRIKQGYPSQLTAMVENGLERISFEHLCQAAEAEDKLVLQVFEEAATYLGLAIANTVNLLNLSKVLVGGDVYCALNHILPVIRRVTMDRSMEVPAKAVQIEPVLLGIDGPAVGAAVLILREYFNVETQRLLPR